MDDATSVDWYSDDNATFGDRVAAAREALGLSQKALAKRLGVASKTVENWEYDAAEPRANKLQMLAGLLNVSMTWLLTGEGEGVSAPDAAAGPSDTTELLVEMRLLRSQLVQSAERVAILEKRLKSMLGE